MATASLQVVLTFGVWLGALGCDAIWIGAGRAWRGRWLSVCSHGGEAGCREARFNEDRSVGGDPVVFAVGVRATLRVDQAGSVLEQDAGS